VSEGVEYLHLVSCTEYSKKLYRRPAHGLYLYRAQQSKSSTNQKTLSISFEFSSRRSHFLDIYCLYLAFTSIND
jgi:hypothetical protein